MKIKINPLLKASVWYIAGNGIGQGLVLVGTVIFTRIMTQENYGIYSTYYSLVSILTSVVGANLFISLANAYIDYKNSIREYRASVLALSTFVFVAICIIGIGSFYFLKIDFPMFLLLMALIHAYAFFVVNFFNNSANMENRYQLKTLFMILPNALQIILSTVFICSGWNNDLYARVIGSTSGVAICALCVYFYMIRGKYKIVNNEYWRYALKISVPSVFSSISYMIMQQSDKIMITKFYNAAETAVYSLVYNIGYILYAFWQATSGIFQVWIYRALDEGNTKNIKKIQKWYLYIFVQLAFGVLMVSPEVIKILAPVSYWNFNYIAPFVLGSATMVMYGLYTTVGMFYKESGRISICVCISALINVILNYLLIPYFGGIAAAYTSVVAYCVLFVLCRGIVQKHNRGMFSLKTFMTFLGAVCVGSMLFSMLKDTFLLRYIVFMVILLLSLLYMWCKKNELIGFIKGR